MKQAIIHACPEVADKISTIHSWADPKYINPIPKYKNEFAIEHKLHSVFTVLYSGNMGRCHDMDTILHAAQYLKEYPIQFVFIGGGSKREEFMRQVAQLELSRCMFLPYQSKSILPYSLTACDASLVSISAGMDAFVAPSKLYSSLSAGRPIVAVCPTESYLSNLINKANCGAAFNNGDSDKLAQYLLQLSSNDRLSKDLGANGRRYLEENFSINRISSQYFEVFQSALYK
jgi:glycosyltransferase involved in cell wall biosynthesis